LLCCLFHAGHRADLVIATLVFRFTKPLFGRLRGASTTLPFSIEQRRDRGTVGFGIVGLSSSRWTVITSLFVCAAATTRALVTSGCLRDKAATCSGAQRTSRFDPVVLIGTAHPALISRHY